VRGELWGDGGFRGERERGGTDTEGETAEEDGKSLDDGGSVREGEGGRERRFAMLRSWSEGVLGVLGSSWSGGVELCAWGRGGRAGGVAAAEAADAVDLAKLNVDGVKGEAGGVGSGFLWWAEGGLPSDAPRGERGDAELPSERRGDMAGADSESRLRGESPPGGIGSGLLPHEARFVGENREGLGGGSGTTALPLAVMATLGAGCGGCAGSAGSSLRFFASSSSCSCFSLTVSSVVNHSFFSLSSLHATVNFRPHCVSKISKTCGKGV